MLQDVVNNLNTPRGNNPRPLNPNPLVNVLLVKDEGAIFQPTVCDKRIV